MSDIHNSILIRHKKAEFKGREVNRVMNKREREREREREKE